MLLSPLFLNEKFSSLKLIRIKNRNYSIPKYFFKASLITHDLGRSNSFAFLSNSSTYSSSTSKLNLTFAIPSILNLLINILYVIIYYLKVNIFKYNIIESIKYYYFLILYCRRESFFIYFIFLLQPGTSLLHPPAFKCRTTGGLKT